MLFLYWGGINMLEVLKEIDKVKKNRTYFHQIPSELDGTIKTAGKVLDKKPIVILKGMEMGEREGNFYKKLNTALTYNSTNIKFSQWEDRYIIQKSLKDEEFSRMIKYIKGLIIAEDAEIKGWMEKVQEKVINDGKVSDVKGKNVVVIDDGLESIRCIVDENEDIKVGSVYDIDLKKNSFKDELYLVLGEKQKDLYELDKICEL